MGWPQSPQSLVSHINNVAGANIDSEAGLAIGLLGGRYPANLTQVNKSLLALASPMSYTLTIVADAIGSQLLTMASTKPPVFQ